MGLTLRLNKQGITDVSDVGEGGPMAGMVPLTNNAWGTGATGDTGETHTQECSVQYYLKEILM